MGKPLPMRALQQIVLRSPFNIRPLLGIRLHESAIGRGYVAGGLRAGVFAGWRSPAATRSRGLVRMARSSQSAPLRPVLQGDPYDYATTSGGCPCGEPLLVWSALIGHAFPEAYEPSGTTEYCELLKALATGFSISPLSRRQLGAV
jgi:hypothetical protein